MISYEMGREYSMNTEFHSLKRFNHLIGELDAVYHEASLKLGMSDSASKILYTICNFGDSCLLTDVCHLTGLTKQTVHSAVHKLEQEGIVSLEAAGNKAKRLRLTEEGKRYASQTALRILEAENEALLSWSRKDVERYLELTEQFLVSPREKVKEF